MKLKVSCGGVEPGSYLARFAGVEATNNDKYGAGLRWKFSVAEGPRAGAIASRVTGTNPSPRNGCGVILAGLLGRPVIPDEEVDVEAHVGKLFLVVVGPTDGGGSRVEAVMPAPAA